MKIRLIEIDNEQEPLRESPSLRLDLTEPLQLPDWAKSIMEIETWQGEQLELSRLEKLINEIPNHISTETRNVIRWKLNDDDQNMEVDFSLILGILSRDILTLDAQNEQYVLTLES